MIQVEHLSKTYRVAKKNAGFKASLYSLFHREREEVHAVKDISFSIPARACVGFLGPNGAGKTTTLKMLAGLLSPSSGRISVLGMTPSGRPKELLRRISLVMGQKQQLLWDLPPADTLELNRAIYDVPMPEFRRILDELVELLNLQAILHKPTRQLSLGERMKCELAAALIHQPEVLFLDEPTIGLDVTMQATVRNFIRRYSENTGATILLTSHYMDDVAALCERVIVIDAGQIRHDGDLKALIQTTQPEKQIHVHLMTPVSPETLRGLQTALALRIQVESERLVINAPTSVVTEAVRQLLDRLPVRDLRVEDPPLEDVMRQVFGSAPP